MGNGSANRGRLHGLARVSALLACVALFAPAAAESKARDRDHDGLSDRYELKKSHTKLRKADSRPRPSQDGYEVRKSKTNPRRADTDRDGLSDCFELRRSRTNPRRRDTDGDGVNDGDELLLGRNPKKPDAPSALNTAPVGPFTVPDLPDPLPDVPDLLPPDTAITTGPTGTVANGTASFSFSSTEANSTFECRIDSGAWLDCDSPHAYAGLLDGVHTFSVRATDESGNTDLTPAQRRWTVAIDHEDTTPPDTSITAGPSGTVTDHSASFSFTSTESGSTFDCRLDGGAWTDCTSPKAYSGLADGSHTFDVRATDSVGNTDASPASRTWTVTTADRRPEHDRSPSGPSGTVDDALGELRVHLEPRRARRSSAARRRRMGRLHPPKSYSGARGRLAHVRRAGHRRRRQHRRLAGLAHVDHRHDAPEHHTSPPGPPARYDHARRASRSPRRESGVDVPVPPRRRRPGGACTSPKATRGLGDGRTRSTCAPPTRAGNTDASPATRTWTVDT